MDATLLKAALPSIPGLNQLPGIRKTGGDPSTLREGRTVAFDADRVRAYDAVCGFPVKDTAPLTYPHVLAFPLHMAIMTSPEFPYPAIGSVHIANSITSHRLVMIGETVHLDVRTSSPRPHPKGTVIDFLATATADGEVVWESTSTYLRRGVSLVVSTGSTDEQSSATDERGGPTEIPDGRTTWQLPADQGRRYAAVSGDHNPIHLYPLTAKAFGFPRQIAHGMWSLARCVAAVGNRLPDAVTVDAAFKKPILLPGTVGFGVETTDDGLAFALTSPKNGAPHLVGRSTPA
jgi:acyl dehydratase